MRPQWNKIDSNVIRMLDANVNRACEGLRVIEDLFRFVIDDEKNSKIAKRLRHALRALFPAEILSNGRDSENDVGKAVIKYGAEKRTSPMEIARANAKRAQEAMRVIEESIKLPEFESDIEDLKACENTRYTLYTLEKTLNEILR